MISYEEAVKVHNKAVEYNRRPHQARPSNTAVYKPSYHTKQTTKGPFYAESSFDYNFSLPPTNYKQPTRQENTNNPSYFPGENQDKESVKIGGYQGGINPVFVSLNKEENRETMSRVPTPPPRDYFPAQDSGTTKYWYEDTPPSTRKPVRRTTERYDSSLYDYGYTKEPYNPPYETTRPTEDQQRYWQDYDLVTPPTYMEQDKLWEGYSKVMDDLLQDRKYSKPAVRKPGMQDRNKYIGDPQFVSTKPIIVGPGIAPGNGSPRQPSSDLLTSYSDRYGWTKNDPSRSAPGRKWTSIELAKPVWDEETGRERQGDGSLQDYQAGSVEQLDIADVNRLEEKETYGNWDQSLNLIPALSRFV